MAFYGYEYEVQPEVSSPSSEEEELIKQTFESMGSQIPFQGVSNEKIYFTPYQTGSISISTVPESIQPAVVPISTAVLSENIPSKISKKKTRSTRKRTTRTFDVPIEYVSESESLPSYTRPQKTEQTEITNWSGPIPLSEYPVNQDENPEIINKKPEETVRYKQEISIRYLRPPSPLPHGDIIIQHEKNFIPPPAPPVVIRQQPVRPETPPPLVIREAPPKPLPKLDAKVITIPGKIIPPPPRKVIIERLPKLPPKPQSIIVERWLPFKQSKRRIIHNKPSEVETYYEKPKNVIIQWETPNVVVNREYRDLGVVKANPEEYMSKFGSEIKTAEELPDFVKTIRPPEGLILAADVNEPHKIYIEGDLEALYLIDLDKEGLNELKSVLPKHKIPTPEVPKETYFVPKQSYLVSEPIYSYSAQEEHISDPLNSTTSEIFNIPVESSQTEKNIEVKKNEKPSLEAASKKKKASEPYISTPLFISSHAYLSSLVESVLDSLILKNDNVINFYEAKEFIKLLNEKLNKTYNDAKAERFLESIRLNRETATMDLEAFKREVMRNLEFYSIYMF